MVNLGNEITDPEYSGTMLDFASHPDDEIWAGGTIAKANENGCNVSVLLVSRGEGGYKDASVKGKTGGTRLDEMKKSQKILGFELLEVRDYLHKGCTAEQASAVDGKIDNNNNYLIEAMVEAIRKVRPDTVLVPYKGDIHVDHQNTYHAAMYSVWRAERPWKSELGRPHRTQRIFQYEITNVMEEPTHLVDITKQWGKVKEAMKCHESQILRDNNYLITLSDRTLTRGKGISDPMVVNQRLDDLWYRIVDEELDITPYDADVALKHYIDFGKRAEAFKAASLQKFW